MKLKNIAEVEAFRDVIRNCTGDVYLRSSMDDNINLKSTLSQYIALGELLKDGNIDLELYCANKEDEALFYAFFEKYPDTP